MLGTLLGTKKKKEEKHYVDANPFEMLSDIGTSVLDSFKNDLVKQGAPNALRQVIGFEEDNGEHKSQEHTGEMHEGEEISLANMKKAEKKIKHDIEPGINYAQEIIHGERRITAEQNYELKSQIEQIQMEIEQLMHVSQEIESSFKDVAVQRVPVKVGKYHKTFLAFVLSALHAARLKVEDSANCLAMMSSKSKKKDYWGMFKQHGTTFGMSSERQVATQAG